MDYLNDMVSEIGFFSLFPGSVLHVKGTDEVRSPAPQQAIEELEEYAREHPELGEGVGQREQDLSHLRHTAMEQLIGEMFITTETAKEIPNQTVIFM